MGWKSREFGWTGVCKPPIPNVRESLKKGEGVAEKNLIAIYRGKGSPDA